MIFTFYSEYFKGHILQPSMAKDHRYKCSIDGMEYLQVSLMENLTVVCKFVLGMASYEIFNSHMQNDETWENCMISLPLVSVGG